MDFELVIKMEEGKSKLFAKVTIGSEVTMIFIKENPPISGVTGAEKGTTPMDVRFDPSCFPCILQDA